MLTHSLSGVVAHKLGGRLTILLTGRSKVKVTVTKTSLELGDKCHVIYNNETGEIIKIMADDEALIDPDAVEQLPSRPPITLEEETSLLDSERECSRLQEFGQCAHKLLFFIYFI